ncbi:glutamine amidotransferase [Paenibacillus sp. J5C_2022]|uniref:type 1 glutamine amidotransferase family protein n=1 Tax=Paenibacillus sp. J5C2022 TaxID=2977129 RepID=UPI0021CF845A|nr:type 1 glutamine amidotransferase family protein [Paenibacillus sp. J5C2022]MCU6707333.1 glutamine amidotransferase [Paenibacillus sp. J5C2022]
MKKEILVFISQNYADWESAYICSELNKPETDFIIKTLAVNKDSVKSMGGFTVVPDYSITEMPTQFQMLILVGGTLWLSGENDEVKQAVDLCIEKDIPVAAICDACTFLANQGYLDHREHTGNSAAYMEELAPNYKGSKHFIEKQVVSNDGWITANGTSAVEFAREILKHFQIMRESELEQWYELFKTGYYKE